jgi:hypothetical protein
LVLAPSNAAAPMGLVTAAQEGRAGPNTQVKHGHRGRPAHLPGEVVVCGLAAKELRPPETYRESMR